MSNQEINMPAERPSLLAFLAACKPSDIDFPDIDNLPPLDDVTDNTDEFKRVPSLIVENWL